MKKLFKILTATLLLVVCFSSLVGCGKSLTKEEVAYKMICYVAEEYNEDPSDVTLLSGKLTEEEDHYFATFKVSVNGYTMYFSGTYYPEKDEIKYNDMTAAIGVLGAGPAYSVTDSFDIDEVNDMLQGN